MANTFSQITIHAVFAVKGRNSFIAPDWQNHLYQYISGIITLQGATSLAVGGWKDHVHILFGMPVTTSIAQFMSIVKANSSKWINQQSFLSGKFQWQEGYGVFSYAKSQRNIVIRYIMTQEAHHQSKTFQQEYLKMLTDFEVKYDDKHLFEFYE